MTRRFLHSAPWSSLLDAWSEACPRLRHTINVRDDRSPSKQAARRAPSTAPKLARLAWKAPGARYPIYKQGEPAGSTAVASYGEGTHERRQRYALSRHDRQDRRRLPSMVA